jgi:ABC-type branched-subunit amino acid transport system ATPase component
MNSAVVEGIPAGSPAAPAAALQAEGVTVRFGGLVALSDVQITVPASTIVGLVGPNGAGKSTLFAVLSGLLRPTEGRVLIGGEDVTGLSARARATRGLRRTFQHPELFQSLTVREHLVVADRLTHAPRRRWSDLLTGRGLHRADPAEDARVERIVDLLGLGPVVDRRAANLPLGTCRLVEVGRALAASPSVLLLDEPSAGLDSSESSGLRELLARVAREDRLALVLVEHDLDLVLGLSELVYVLDFGVRIAAGTPDDIRRNPAVRRAYLGALDDPAKGSEET